MTNRIGAYLRQKRTEEHLTLQQVAEHTGIREQYLTALEEGNFSFIPGDVFIRGFLRNYGNYLGLDGNLVVEAYRMDLNPEKVLGPLAQPLEVENPEAAPAEAQAVPEEKLEQESASSDTIVITPDMFSQKAEKQPEEPRTAEPEGAAEAAEPEGPVIIAVPEAEEPVTACEQPAEAEAEETAETSGEGTPQEKEIHAETVAAAALLNGQQVSANAQKVEDHKEEEAAAAAAAGAAVGAGAAKGKLQGIIDTVRDFIDENLYETVPVDDEEDGEEEQEPAKAPEKPAFSFKVFSGVFIVCLLLFTGVMAYFIFGGKTQEELEPTTKITDGVKSDHSSEKAEAEAKKKAEAEKAAKEAAEKKKKEEEEKKKKATNKTLGLGSKVTVQIKYKKAVWTQTYVDGKVVEAVVVPAGSTRTYKGDREVRLNLGSIRDVELHVNGRLVPYGEKEWGVANKVFTPKS